MNEAGESRLDRPAETLSVHLVTGGSRGIGRELVEVLAVRGASVYFTFLQDEAGAAETARGVVEKGGRAQASRRDVTDPDAMDDWVQEILRREGRIDTLVNNAGHVRDDLLAFQSREDWKQVLEVNLGGTRHACRAVLRPMVQQRRGRIVNLASTSALLGAEGQTAYAAAKGGVIAFTRSLAREAAPFGVTVNTVVPGPIETDMWAKVSEPKRKAILQRVPLGRAGTPREVAAAVVYLLSEGASYITGTTLRVDGGLAM